MTDAQEIIARAIEPFVHHADDVTSVIANTLTTAGYRILGPDEVDPVTVDRCAAVAERMLRFADTTSEADIAISEAIRAIGRKA